MKVLGFAGSYPYSHSIEDKNNRQRFITITQPKTEEIIHLTHKISLRIGRYLERAGLLERDAENSYLSENALSNNEMGEHQIR